eukprot:gene2180-3092_t
MEESPYHEPHAEKAKEKPHPRLRMGTQQAVIMTLIFSSGLACWCGVVWALSRPVGRPDGDFAWSIPRRAGQCVRVAFLADTALNEYTVRVLEMIGNADVDVVSHQGDADYSDRPDVFFKQVRRYLGGYVRMVLAIGNAEHWPRSSSIAQYTSALPSFVHPPLRCCGRLGEMSSCIYGDVLLVHMAPTLNNVSMTEYTAFANASLAQHQQSRWKVCAWHKPTVPFHQNAPPRDADYEPGLELYEVCRRHGALIVTGHKHYYARTRPVSSFSPNGPTGQWPEGPLSPGVSMLVIAGLGGRSVTEQDLGKARQPLWAASWPLDNRNPAYGALICDFCAISATCTFHTIDGHAVDTFMI